MDKEKEEKKNKDEAAKKDVELKKKKEEQDFKVADQALADQLNKKSNKK